MQATYPGTRHRVCTLSDSERTRLLAHMCRESFFSDLKLPQNFQVTGKGEGFHSQPVFAVGFSREKERSLLWLK